MRRDIDNLIIYDNMKVSLCTAVHFIERNLQYNLIRLWFNHEAGLYEQQYVIITHLVGQFIVTQDVFLLYPAFIYCLGDIKEDAYES